MRGKKTTAMRRHDVGRGSKGEEVTKAPCMESRGAFERLSLHIDEIRTRLEPDLSNAAVVLCLEDDFALHSRHQVARHETPILSGGNYSSTASLEYVQGSWRLTLAWKTDDWIFPSQ